MNKYNAKKTTVCLCNGENRRFDSMKEANRAWELSVLQKAGKIQDLRFQVPFELIPSQKRSDGTTERSVKYIADFVYKENGKTIVEDVKGCRKGAANSIYVLKRKMLLSKYGITVKEV